ncbi:MAG TPA: ATP-binding protein [Candidatus Solibacter sp.]|jgi:two-component system sensor histidine kinase BaeS|nr:ATP-binding protein [Candidatus Solibacter sp.]
MRRAFFFVLTFMVMVIAVITATIWLIANVVGINGAGTSLRIGSLALLVVVYILLRRGGRVFRGIARPVGELVDAASQIEAGDFTVRVRERGPQEVRQVSRAFNEMAEQLQAADARRRAFLADVSHELRTPLSVIRGRAEGIMDGVYPGDAEHVGPVLDAARTLERLIEDLRTLALADAGGLTLHREPVDIGVLVRETMATFESSAAEGGVRLEANVASDLPLVQADPGRIQSVLSNLITNAIRHTPSGGSVRVAVGRTAGSVDVSVSDTGEGIAQDLLPNIFERFVKGSSSSGSGLGLAIARDLVVAHGGRIEAKSQPGSGTTITFSLPLG